MDQKKIGDLGIAFIGGRPQNNGGVEGNGMGDEDAELRREMGFRAGRIESWCDPLDGSIQVMVGMGEEGVRCRCGKTRQGGVEFLPGDSELARPKRAAEATQGFSAVLQLRQGAPASPD